MMPHFKKPLLTFLSESEAPHTSSLDKIFKNSDFDSLDHIRFNQRNKTLPQWSLRDLNTATSRGVEENLSYGADDCDVLFTGQLNSAIPQV